MDPRLNPYTPNAGAKPPALVGRDDELEAFEVLLARLQRGRAEQSLLVTGLRGVGKTVLLGAFQERAIAAGWVYSVFSTSARSARSSKWNRAASFRASLWKKRTSFRMFCR